jgi:hypothetical protein
MQAQLDPPDVTPVHAAKGGHSPVVRGRFTRYSVYCTTPFPKDFSVPPSKTC